MELSFDAAALLGRAECAALPYEAGEWLRGKTLLVTGGGGSIGAELCRQAAAFSPERVVIFEISENNAVEIRRALQSDFPRVAVAVEIGSVRDKKRLREVFSAARPDLVIHTAAHKHVPLMERAPGEAVKNNVFGTQNVLRAARRAGTGQFLLISTDKAVRPTGVMGRTKRVCELLTQAENGKGMRCCTVRFGNVLASSGSVVPLFLRQIAAGGPVTVSGPGVTRYFMTIPEAASLVLQAGARSKGGEVFALGMGEPAPIDLLARRLIALSGRTEEEIPIRYTGLQAGEKAHEEPLTPEDIPCGALYAFPQTAFSRFEARRLLLRLKAGMRGKNDARLRALLSEAASR